MFRQEEVTELLGDNTTVSHYRDVKKTYIKNLKILKKEIESIRVWKNLPGKHRKKRLLTYFKKKRISWEFPSWRSG